MVHYREFAPQREIAEAAATWPLVHRAAAESGSSVAAGPAPQGDTAARERIARDSRILPAMAPLEQHVPAAEAAPYDPDEIPSTEAEAGLRLEDRPVARAAVPNPTEAVEAPPPAAMTEGRRQDVGPTIAGFDEPPRPLRSEPPHRAAAREAEPSDAPYYPGRQRSSLFGGEYGGGERDQRRGGRVSDRQDRSLDAVFSRLAGGRDRLPDPRGRARTNPGLAPVFNRLR